MTIYDHEQKYRRWWLGKLVRQPGCEEYRLVVDIQLVGPPSFVYGDVLLMFRKARNPWPVPHSGFRPTRKDLEVL